MLLLVFCGLAMPTYSQTYRNTEILIYEFGYINFKSTRILLPDTVSNLPMRDLTRDTLIQGIFFDKKQKLDVFSDCLDRNLLYSQKIEWCGKQEIPESFVNLLCENDMVSIARDYGHYDMIPYYRKNADEFIQNFKERNEFWFLGKLSLNPNYDSYLIFSSDKDTTGFIFIRSLFLMNVKDNIITSLTQIAYNFILEADGSYYFTKAASQGRYCYYSDYQSMFFYQNRFGKIKVKEPKVKKITYYKFDDDGYVQVQELKGRKKFIIYKYRYKFFENVR